MPLRVYKELSAIVGSGRETESLEIYATLNGVSLEEIMEMPISQVSQMSSKAQFLAQQPTGLGDRVGDHYKVGKYDLVPVMDVQKMTTAQYIDFQTYAAQMEGGDMTAELLSCLLVPKGKTYATGYDIEDLRAALNEHLPVIDALNLVNFFLSSLQGLIRRFLTYSEGAVKRLEREARKTKDETKKKTAKALKERTESMRALQGVGDGLLTLMQRLKLADAVGMKS